MAVLPYEASDYEVHIGQQTAYGTEAASPKLKLRHVEAALNVPDNEGREQHSDGRRRATPVIFNDKIIGEGSPAFQATPRTIAFMFGSMLGQSVVSGASAPFTHTATDAASCLPLTVWQCGGTTVTKRDKWVDTRITSLQLVAGAGQKVARITPSFSSLDPEIKIDATPTAELDETLIDPYLVYDLDGSLVIPGINSGNPISEVNSVNLALTESITDWQGSNVRSIVHLPGRLSLQLTLNVLLTSETLKGYNLARYGVDAPTNNTKPIADKFEVGPISFAFSRQISEGDDETTTITIDQAILKVVGEISGQPNGGGVEVQFVLDSIPGNAEDLVTIASELPDEDNILTLAA